MKPIDRLIQSALTQRERWSYRKVLTLRFVEGVLIAVTSATAFLLVTRATAAEGFWQLILICLGLFVGILLLRYVIASIAMTISHGTTYAATLALRDRILRHLVQLPLGSFRKLHAGKVAHILSEDMMWIEYYGSHAHSATLAERVTLAALLVSVGVVHWPMAIAAIATWGFGLFALSLLKKRLERGLRFRSDGLAEASKHLMEYAEGIQVVRSFGGTGAAERDYNKWVEIMREGFRKAITRNTPLATLANSLATIAVGIGALTGVLTLPVGAENVWRIVVATGALTATVIPARAVITHSLVTSLATISGQNIDNIEAIPALAAHGSAPRNGEIRFDNVAFTYDGGNRAAISGMSFCAKPGSVTAIVGRSGSGKTTLMNLLLRFWDYDSGTITLGGQDIRSYELRAYMNRFAVVFQETMLFRDTIENNIRLGNPLVSFDDVVDAAKAAQIHETVIALPEGYATVVGHGGSTLSGGERQRLTIARALLKNADIVILDEATSALDPENEREIQLAFQALARDKTVFVIAHRLSTIIEADNILVLDQGAIVDQGRHQDLLARSGVYADLWRAYQDTAAWSL